MVSPDIRPLSRPASSCHQCWVSSHGSWQSPELSSSSNTQSLSGMRADAEPGLSLWWPNWGLLWCCRSKFKEVLVEVRKTAWELRFLRTETQSYDWAGRQVRELMPEIGRYDARWPGCRVSAQHNCRPDQTWMIISVFKPAFPCLWRD